MDNTIISKKATILQALEQIDSISNKGTRTLFVVDDNNKVVGSLSDGDCRRALIANKNLLSPVESATNKNFLYLNENKFDIEKIKRIKELGLQYIPELSKDGELIKVIDFSNGKSYLPVDAVLMAGGKGERLRPLTLETPKPLLLVDGKPIIDYNIENLEYFGISNINITVNYLAEQIEAHFEKLGKNSSSSYTCVKEDKFLGTMGAVKYVKEWHNDTVLLMNSDLFTNINLEAFYLDFVKSGADMCVAGVPYNVNIPYGIFTFDDDDNVTGMKEKPSYYYYANAGIYLFKKEIIDFIPKNEMFHATDMIDLLIQKGKKVTKFPIAGYWIDIGKPEDFKKVQEFARNINGR